MVVFFSLVKGDDLNIAVIYEQRVSGYFLCKSHYKYLGKKPEVASGLQMLSTDFNNSYVWKV